MRKAFLQQRQAKEDTTAWIHIDLPKQVHSCSVTTRMENERAQALVSDLSEACYIPSLPPIHSAGFLPPPHPQTCLCKFLSSRHAEHSRIPYLKPRMRGRRWFFCWMSCLEFSKQQFRVWHNTCYPGLLRAFLVLRIPDQTGPRRRDFHCSSNP